MCVYASKFPDNEMNIMQERTFSLDRIGFSSRQMNFGTSVVLILLVDCRHCGDFPFLLFLFGC